MLGRGPYRGRRARSTHEKEAEEHPGYNEQKGEGGDRGRSIEIDRGLRAQREREREREGVRMFERE
jgi:hypothetical protein